mmetsp:Transcript_28537/g.87578  ORF Transcript_28537/g.87578 Transcript_28537/m.87578 type:complete len:942 (+) Transcript_28537:434-3259(+)
MLYFWDERDGPALCGWWFGPKVGGDQVWAFHATKDLVPPASGWMVPFNGPIDPTLQVKPSSTPSLGGMAKPAQAQQGQQLAATRPASSATAPVAVSPQQQRPWSGVPQQGPSCGSAGGFAAQQQQQWQQQQRQQQQQQQMDEARRKQQEEMRQKMEENKRRMEEANRKRKEEQEAEMKRKAEEQKKRLEDVKKKKEEEERQKRGVLEKRALEMKAMTAIRQAQQKVRIAKFDNYDDTKRELEEVLDRERPHLGDKELQVQEECEKVVAQVQKRIDAVKEQRRKEEERKLEDEKKKREQEERAEELVMELRRLVEVAEAALEELKKKSAALSTEAQLSVEQVEATAVAIKEAGAEAETLATNASEFFRTNHPAMKLAPTVKPAPQAEGLKDTDKQDTRQVLSQILQRIGTCKREAGSIVEKSSKVKSSILTRAAAREKTQEFQELFKKYDKDLDDMLSRKEVLAYAQAEFDFSLPAAALDTIWEHYTEYSAKHGDRGVAMGGFQLVKVAVGVAREIQRDDRRRLDRQAKQRRFEEAKVHMQEKIKRAVESVTEADQAVSKAEEDVKPLATKSKGLRVPQMKVLADEISGIIQKAKQAVTVAKQKMDGLKQEIEEDFKAELLGFISNETKKHDSKLGRMDGRINRALNLLTRFQDEVSKKRAGEVDKVRLAALRVARYNQQLQNLTDEDLFGRFDVGGDGAIDESEFLAFFEAAEKVIRPLKADTTPEEEGGRPEEAGKDVAEKEEVETVELLAEDLAEVFAILCQHGEKALSMEAFMQAVPQYMVVVKQTAMTDGLSIKDSKTVRRLELDEIVKVVRGPVRESATKVMRTFIRALKDDAEGWVSAVGNAGTTFLREGGSQFKVVKETILTDTFDLEAEGGSTKKPGEAARKLKVGEVLDVREWPKKEIKSGLVRLKVCAKSDGAIGWATATGNQGTLFLKVL